MDLELFSLHIEKRDVEGTSTQVKDKHVLLTLTLLIESVGDGYSSGFIDDPHHIKAGNNTCIFSGLSLK